MNFINTYFADFINLIEFICEIYLIFFKIQKTRNQEISDVFRKISFQVLYILFTEATGLPTKDATSTTTVELLSGFILTNYALWSHSLTESKFVILFINAYKDHMKGKDRLHLINR